MTLYLLEIARARGQAVIRREVSAHIIKIRTNLKIQRCPAVYGRTWQHMELLTLF